MPLMLQVFNTTLEDFKTQFNSKGYRFRRRSLTKIPEEFEPFIVEQYGRRGLVIVRPGDDLKAKEREGWISYLGFLNERIDWTRMYLDEKKRNGVTIDDPESFKRLKQWKDEITTKLEMGGYAEQVPSFNDLEEIDSKTLFAGEVKVTELRPIEGPAKVTPTSFSNLNIEEELSA